MTATPCVDPTCRNTPSAATRHRRRGMCDACYGRHQRAGTLDRFPRVERAPILHPAPPPARFDPPPTAHRLPWGAPQTPQWARRVAWESERSAAWLRERRVAA